MGSFPGEIYINYKKIPSSRIILQGRVQLIPVDLNFHQFPAKADHTRSITILRFAKKIGFKYQEPGHSNAVFVQDANKLLVDDAMDAFREADAQGAFIFWNHPSWLSQSDDGTPPLSDMHKELIEKGLLHGIEVVNHDRYSKEALQIALNYDLTIMGTSDVHGLIDWDYEVHHGEHRPVTLVFAEEYSKEGLKEALFDGRTVVWKEDLLIGKEEFLVPLIEGSLEITGSSYIGDTSVLDVEITNHTGQRFIMENQSEYSLHHHADVFTLNPYSSTNIRVMTLERLDHLSWPMKVLNGITAPDSSPVITLESSLE